MIKVWQRDWSIDQDPHTHLVLGYETVFAAEEYLKNHFATDYKMVAEIDMDDLEDAFDLTGCNPDNWMNDPVVTAHTTKNVRSIAVGDVLEIDNKKFLVRGVGFLKIS